VLLVVGSGKTNFSDPIAEEDYIFVCKEDNFWHILDNPVCENI